MSLLGAAACTSGSDQAGRAADQSYEQVVEAALPSVVFIATGSGIGSGVVYDTKGHIVTNAHVIGKASTMQVTFSTGGPAQVASVVASYPLDDLAVVTIGKAPPVRPATFVNTDNLAVGQRVLAIGAPLGLTSSVTDGIVSALGRTVTEPATGGAPATNIPNMVQTSASINPGNSGGALVDLHGRVVGIPTLAAVDPNIGSQAPGIGFAVSSQTATHIADQLIRDGRVTNSGRAGLGAAVGPATDTKGALVGGGVISVQPDGPAARAGIQVGDVITAVGESALDTRSALADALGRRRPGDRVKLTLTRDGASQDVTVTLGEL